MKTDSTMHTLTVSDVAEILRISKTRAYEMVNSQMFPVIKDNKILRVPSKPFFEWLNNPGCIEQNSTTS